MEKMIKALSYISKLSEEDCNNLAKICDTIELQKGDYWIEANKENTMLAFVNEGYLRKYYLKGGKEITDFFYFDNDFCADLPSIIGKLKPHANIVAMDKTVLTTFSYQAFNKLCETSLNLEHLLRIIVESTFLRFYNRTNSFILQSPIERYNDLLKSNSTILQRATQYHIASYLGISYQHLSRLRGGNSL